LCPHLLVVREGYPVLPCVVIDIVASVPGRSLHVKDHIAGVVITVDFAAVVWCDLDGGTERELGLRLPGRPGWCCHIISDCNSSNYILEVMWRQSCVVSGGQASVRDAAASWSSPFSTPLWTHSSSPPGEPDMPTPPMTSLPDLIGWPPGMAMTFGS